MIVGYEVTYKYHERKDGNYDKEELKSLKKKVGDPFEEVPLEKLAGAVMAQFARRDIFVTDVEIVELSRKPISFKETNGGIVIKNRKFLFDQASPIENFVEVSDIPSPSPVPVPSSSAISIQRHPHEMIKPETSSTELGRPIDHVIFSPEIGHIPEVKRKGLKLTPDKKYGVYGREQIGAFTVLKIVDDAGRQQNVSDIYFIPGNINLYGDKELGFSETQTQKEGGKLNWNGAVNDDSMPFIRG